MPVIKRDAIDIHYQTHGAGTPFLFFSETACAGDIWNKFQVPEFSRDHMVITHDYRGTGKSSRPTTKYSCVGCNQGHRQYTADVARFAQWLDTKLLSGSISVARSTHRL